MTVRPRCPNGSCSGEQSVIRYGFYLSSRGQRRRYRCRICGKTFCSTTNTPYYRLRYPRSRFDRVAALSVEGVSRSSIARVERLTWNTVDRWLERAASAARVFNDFKTRGFELVELQADEIRTFAPNKSRTVWVFTSMEVSSRLWVSTAVGRRSYRNTLKLLNDTAARGRLSEIPLITTDGFEFYARVIGQIFGAACVYAQVIKSWRQDRVTRVDKTLIIGTSERMRDALVRSEDSAGLNTAYIERLNLTIRACSAYLRRRSLYHARCWHRLDDHLQLARVFYNFIKEHAALRFGKETRTPAMQAGLAGRRYRFRDIFMAVPQLPVRRTLIVHFRLRPMFDTPIRKAA